MGATESCIYTQNIMDFVVIRRNNSIQMFIENKKFLIIHYNNNESY
jgi:hypothetical protein